MDIVERLLRMSGPHKPNVCSDAADEILRLRERIKELEEHHANG